MPHPLGVSRCALNFTDDLRQTVHVDLWTPTWKSPVAQRRLFALTLSQTENIQAQHEQVTTRIIVPVQLHPFQKLEI